MKKFGPAIKKLQNAINGTGKHHIIINKTQFYVEQDNKIAEVIVVKEVTIDRRGKATYTEIFSSTSDICIVLFLRDMWYELNGWEIPTDNAMWEEAKVKYANRVKRGKTHEQK